MDINSSRWVRASLPCGFGHKNKISCFHPTSENFRSSFLGFLGGSQACLPAPCVSARLPPQGPWVNPFASSFWVENGSLPTKNSLEGKEALESLGRKSSPGARVGPAEPSPGPPHRSHQPPHPGGPRSRRSRQCLFSVINNPFLP